MEGIKMADKNIQQTTFWEFLQKTHKIEIPIIQRDYAQGRIGKEKLREKFLTDLKKALDGKLLNDEKVLKLDFVYGSIDNDRLNPLDGQQRLTTLWLLHWYIAFKASALSENRAVFKNFSYETRISSREFCKKLSDFDVRQKDEIVSLIQNQTWFLSVWKQDPTIQAMLNMLGGTPIKDNKDNEILDGIEEVFIDCDYSSYWEKLTSKECPIIFYYLDLLELSLSDDLYIKMNARGKSLTNFENFKADLVGFIKEKEYDKGKKPYESIAHKLDTTWTDIFWKHKSEEHKIDDIYFAFINRYFLNELITAKKSEKDFLYTQEQIESNKLFKYLNGKSGDDSNVKYDSFDVYKSEKDVFDDKLFDRLDKTLDNFYSAFQNISKEEIIKMFLPLWDSNSDFRFIPEYLNNPKANDKNNEPKYISAPLTQPQRVVFFAICSYFEDNQYNENVFMQWMRVVWNIVENVNIETRASMIGAMRLIDELKPNTNTIYNFLADSSSVIKSDTAKEQVAEEIEKAKQIVNDKTNTWESEIIEAEKTAFFKGTIRFLFRTSSTLYDWNKFDDRFGKAKLYFDKKGVSAIYKKNAILLRAFISFFTEWEQFWHIVYDNSQTSWKTTLIDIKWIKPISNLLDYDIPGIENCQLTLNGAVNEREKLVHRDLVYSSLLSHLIEGCKLNYRHEKYALYPPNANANWKKYVIGDMRNKIIFDLRENGIISTDQNISGIPYFWGWEIYFTSKLNNKKYQWWNSLKEQTENSEWKIVPDVNLDNLEEYLNKC